MNIPLSGSMLGFQRVANMLLVLEYFAVVGCTLASFGGSELSLPTCHRRKSLLCRPWLNPPLQQAVVSNFLMAAWKGHVGIESRANC